MNSKTRTTVDVHDTSTVPPSPPPPVIHSYAGKPSPCHNYTVVPSTLDVARGLVCNGAPPWTVVTTDSQCAGRGTRGRDWFDAPGLSLLISVVCPPPPTPDTTDGLTVMTAEVLRDVITALTGLETVVKFPNDLLAGGRKLAGILYETATVGDRMDAVLLGMGVNLGHSRRILDDAGLPDATSIFIESGMTPDRDSMLDMFMERFIPAFYERVSPETRTEEEGR
jgi:BirA family transcriptional regulator, biotin operon repressor / biotin---[acetyl-CoA-carboxylase] ligase